MMETSLVHYATAGFYVVSAIVLTAATARKTADSRYYCYPFIALIVLAGAMAVVWGAGLGRITIGAGELVVPQAVTDYPAYILLFGSAAYMANAEKRYITAVVGLLLLARVAYDIVTLFNGVIGLIGNLVIFVGYLGAVGLLFGPVATIAKQQSPQRELLYKKTRNLVVFIFAMLVIWSQLQVTGLLDQFTLAVTLQYTNVVFRVGFAAFVIMNVEVLSEHAFTDSTRPTTLVSH